MPLLPDLRFAPYAQPYIGNANQEYANLLKQKITDYDVAKSQDDILGLQTDSLLESVGPFEADRNYALKLQNIFRNKIESRATKGNYEDLMTETTRDAREFMKKIVPLQENYKRYSDYITSIDKQVQEDKIDRLTAEAAKRYSVSSYKGFDPNNIGSTLFTGIQPGKRFDLTDYINKIGNDWESNKRSVEIELPNGRTITRKFDVLSKEELANGFKRALEGDRQFQDYKMTQGILGLEDKLAQEINEAVTFGINKYSKSNVEQSLGFIPEWARNEAISYDGLLGVKSVPNTPIINPNANSILKTMSFDDATGQVVGNKSNYFTKVGNNVYKVVDKNGNTVPKTTLEEERLKENASPDFSGLGSLHPDLTREGRKIVPVTQEEIRQLDNEQAAIFDDIVRNAELVNNRTFKTAKERRQVYDSYNKAIEKLQVFTENRRIDPGTEFRFRGNGLDQVVANDLSGRKIFIKSSDSSIGGLPNAGDTKEGVDFNSLLTQLYESDDKWQVVATKGNGFDLVNLYGDNPSTDIKLNLKNKDGKTATLKIGAELTPTEGQALKPLQDVMKLYTVGRSGKVALPNGMSFKVNVGPNINTNSIVGSVSVLDKNGNELDNVDITTFDNYYINLLQQQDRLLIEAGYPSIMQQLFGKNTKKFYEE